MARKLIAMSQALFCRLVDHAEQEGMPVAHPHGGRFIKRTNDIDADLMAAGRATAVVLTRQIRLVRIEHADQMYFCTFGLPEPDEPLLGLENIPATPGIFALATIEANIHPRRAVTAAMIKNVLDDAYIDNERGYAGHDLDEIMYLFSAIAVYRTTDQQEYLTITERVLGSILARTYRDGAISLQPETVEIFTRVFEQDSAFIPFRNLIQGLLSISWETLFIEIYRCIEQLYALPRVEGLKTVLLCDSPARELAKMLEEHLSWYPKEEESFKALVRLWDETIVSAICVGLQGGEGDTHDKRCDNAVRQLYRFRNQIVHYRPIHETIKKSDDEWSIIVRGMLRIVSHLYNTRGAAFFGAI